MSWRVVVALLGASFAFADSKNQVFSDFTTPLPLHDGDTLIVGIVGGWERWDAPQRMIRRVALRIREKNIPSVYVETIENHKINLAEELVTKAFPDPKAGNVILFGQSLGGSATIRFARRLKELGYFVRMAVIVDSYGNGDKLIPANVGAAVNFYQEDQFWLKGEPVIQAEDPDRTRVLGNYKFSYRGKYKTIHFETEPWIRRTFMRGHLQMEYDPEVWKLVECHILTAVPQWTDGLSVRAGQ